MYFEVRHPTCLGSKTVYEYLVSLGMAATGARSGRVVSRRNYCGRGRARTKW